MVDVKEIVDKMNIKEVVVLVLGDAGEIALDNVLSNFITDENQKTIAKVAIGLGGAYAMNELAESNREWADILALAGLGFSAIAAKSIAQRVTGIIMTAAKAKPVVVTQKVSSSPKPAVVTAGSKGAVSI